MFFYIGDNCPLTALKQVEPRLFLDDGWNYKSGIWYKGYSTECVLEDSVYDIVNGYQPAGKWCVICAEEIYHPVLRGFPVFQQGNNQTNIKLENYSPVEYETVPYISSDDILSLEDVSTQIGDILLENTENFYRYNEVKDMTVVFSCGLDTSTVWAIHEAFSPKFSLSFHVPDFAKDNTVHAICGTVREYNSDLIENADSNHWGYTPVSYYKHTAWFSAGYYAEVYTYRDAEAINAIANYRGRKIYELANEADYLYWFLKRPGVVETYKNSNKEFESINDLKRYLWSTIWYDHQMWHLDKTMMFCPFADLRIPMMMDKLSVEDLATACVTGAIQKNIIGRFKPELLSILSDYKNEKDVWQNFKSNFNESMVNPRTKLIYR